MHFLPHNYIYLNSLMICSFLEHAAPPQQAPPGYAATPYTPPPQGGGYQNQTTTATVYVQPAQQSRTVLVGVQPPNYLVLSIVTTVFFCWVFGLIALVIGQKVRGWGLEWEGLAVW